MSKEVEDWAIKMIKYALKKEINNIDPIKISLIFRDDVVSTRMWSTYLTIKGKEYLEKIMHPFYKNLDKKINLINVEDISNASNHVVITELVQSLIMYITNSVSKIPKMIREMCKYISLKIQKKFPNNISIVLNGISSLFFLRFICLAIIYPKNYNLLKNNKYNLGLLVTISKIIQKLATNMIFDDSDKLYFCNNIIKNNITNINTFLFDIIEYKQEQYEVHKVSGHLDPDKIEKLQNIHHKHNFENIEIGSMSKKNECIEVDNNLLYINEIQNNTTIVQPNINEIQNSTTIVQQDINKIQNSAVISPRSMKNVHFDTNNYTVVSPRIISLINANELNESTESIDSLGSLGSLESNISNDSNSPHNSPKLNHLIRISRKNSANNKNLNEFNTNDFDYDHDDKKNKRNKNNDLKIRSRSQPSLLKNSQHNNDKDNIRNVDLMKYNGQLSSPEIPSLLNNKDHNENKNFIIRNDSGLTFVDVEPSKWTNYMVLSWLRCNELSEYCQNFGKITGKDIIYLNEENLHTLCGIQKENKYKYNRLIIHLNQLKNYNNQIKNNKNIFIIQ
jgi:hypothetical protein